MRRALILCVIALAAVIVTAVEAQSDCNWPVGQWPPPACVSNLDCYRRLVEGGLDGHHPFPPNFAFESCYPESSKISAAPTPQPSAKVHEGRFRVTFNAKGNVTNVEVVKSSGYPSFDSIAVDTLWQRKCEPGEAFSQIVPMSFEDMVVKPPKEAQQ